jgi:hypothetical protein
METLDNNILGELHTGVDQYVVDLSELKYIPAPNAVYLLLLIEYLKRISATDPLLLPPTSEQVISFLSNIHFLVLVESVCDINKPHPFPEPVDPKIMARRAIMEIKHIPVPAKMPSGTFYTWVGKSVKNTIIDKLSKISEGQLNALANVYIELVKNIHEHSGSSGYVAAQKLTQKDTRSPRLVIAIGDLGIGMKKSLDAWFTMKKTEREKRYGPVWDDGKAIDVAFCPGVTSKDTDMHEGAGAGLYSVLESIQEQGGSLICRSGTSKVFLGFWRGAWRTRRKCNLCYFPGMQLEVSIPIKEET